jgi:periplasmic protein TonB
VLSDNSSIDVTLLHHAVPFVSLPGATGQEVLFAVAGTGDRLQAPHQNWRPLLLAIAISGIVHAALLAALLRPSDQQPSAGATNLEAIAISIVSNDSLAAASSSSPSTPSAPPPNLAPDRPDQPNDAPAEVPLPMPEKMLDTLVTPAADDLAAEASKPAQPEKPDSASATSGGDGSAAPQQTVSLSSAPTNSSGEGGASRGQIEEFAKSVAVVLARSRPKGVGRKGRVEIEFVLSERTGTLQTARVTNTSGQERLDAMALATVQKTSFPAPPPQMTTRQLTFRVPFTFE